MTRATLQRGLGAATLLLLMCLQWACAAPSPLYVKQCGCKNFLRDENGTYVKRVFAENFERDQNQPHAEYAAVKVNRFHYHNMYLCHLQACEACKGLTTYLNVNPKKFMRIRDLIKAAKNFDDDHDHVVEKICGQSGTPLLVNDVEYRQPKFERFGLGDHQYRIDWKWAHRGANYDPIQHGDWTYQDTSYSEDVNSPMYHGDPLKLANDRCRAIVKEFLEMDEDPDNKEPKFMKLAEYVDSRIFPTRKDTPITAGFGVTNRCEELSCCWPHLKDWSDVALPDGNNVNAFEYFSKRRFKAGWFDFSWFRKMDVTRKGLPLQGSGRTIWTTDLVDVHNPSSRRYTYTGDLMKVTADETYDNPLGHRPPGGFMGMYLHRIPKYQLRQGLLDSHRLLGFHCPGCTSVVIEDARMSYKHLEEHAAEPLKEVYSLTDKPEVASMTCQLLVQTLKDVEHNGSEESEISNAYDMIVGALQDVDDFRCHARHVCNKKFPDCGPEPKPFLEASQRDQSYEARRRAGGIDSEVEALVNSVYTLKDEVKALYKFYYETDVDPAKPALESLGLVSKTICRQLEICGDLGNCGYTYYPLKSLDKQWRDDGNLHRCVDV